MSRDEFDEQRQLAFEMSEKAADAQDELDGGRWRAEATAARDALIAASRHGNGPDFSSNDVRDIAGDPDRPAAWGSLFSGPSRAGEIYVVGHELSRSPGARARYVAVWRAADWPRKTAKGAQGTKRNGF
jgi:hypothetical protein